MIQPVHQIIPKRTRSTSTQFCKGERKSSQRDSSMLMNLLGVILSRFLLPSLALFSPKSVFLGFPPLALFISAPGRTHCYHILRRGGKLNSRNAVPGASRSGCVLPSSPLFSSNEILGVSSSVVFGVWWGERGRCKEGKELGGRGKANR